ncbi:MAG: type I restriction enzyme HsdR N-terminal domain-containing protein [Alistipes sp.]|nr:type I restriction enzyme HsdR N-terminal domain-containing protein [Alistipes sp.]
MPESVKLIFPTISPRIKSEEGEKFIWDSLRGKWLVLTPEEWVRQHTIGWLVAHKGVPALRITQEYPVKINGLNQRADIVVMNEMAKPHILVECKAPDVILDHEVVMQAIRYNSIVGARYILLTNGLKLYGYEYADGKYRGLKEF